MIEVRDQISVGQQARLFVCRPAKVIWIKGLRLLDRSIK